MSINQQMIKAPMNELSWLLRKMVVAVAQRISTAQSCCSGGTTASLSGRILAHN